ncbi:hypothetical protein U1Q18_051391 [Sarracenia purpurea var. burkii]
MESDCSEEDDLEEICIICEERGKTEEWYKCNGCKRWAHADCTGWTKKEKILQDELTVANSKLNARPNFEIQEKEVVPLYLLNATYLSREEKWYLSLKYRASPAACVLRDRFIGDHDYRKVAKAMASVFQRLSEIISHKKNSIMRV